MKRLNLTEAIASVTVAALAILICGIRGGRRQAGRSCRAEDSLGPAHQWPSFRAGYAKSSVSDAANGSVGVVEGIVELARPGGFEPPTF